MSLGLGDPLLSLRPQRVLPRLSYTGSGQRSDFETAARCLRKMLLGPAALEATEGAAISKGAPPAWGMFVLKLDPGSYQSFPDFASPYPATHSQSLISPLPF